MKKIILCCCLLAVSSTIFCQSGGNNDKKGLKDFYAQIFPVGVAVSPRDLKGAEASLILKHFGTLTPENVMKMGPIHPDENRYFWDDADAIVTFAQNHDLKVRGHTLCWHQQTPDWIFKDLEGEPVTKEVLLSRLKEHITSVVSRYKGKVYAWDVVNEAVSDDSTQALRDSPWYKICGEEFIGKAFEYAHAADPDAKLFYNDYNTENPGKRERVYNLLKKLVDAGVPIDGVGLQGHWSLTDPAEGDLNAAIEKYASLKLAIQITELDVSVYPKEKGRRDLRPGESDTFTEEMKQKQSVQYQKIFSVLRNHKNEITGVTFWNISDRHSWLDNFPVKGRKNYPLLFDENLKPKKAYWEVVNF